MNMRAEGIHMINGMKKDEIMNGNRGKHSINP